MLIGLSGKKRSGKDTVADRLVSEYGFVRVSFAQPLKDMLYALNPIVSTYQDPVTRHASPVRAQHVIDTIGWERAKDRSPEIRQLLQRMGTEAGRNVLGENVWVDLAIARTKEYLAGGAKGVVITDMRFPNELDAVWRAGGFAVRVERPGLESTDTHASETALDNIRAWSLVLHNDSTIADLHQRVDEMHGYFVGARVNA